jgi:hypothetical protein
MRDYKHVKVPRRYRTSASRTAIKRVEAGPGRRRKTTGIKGGLFTALLLLAAAGGLWLAGN